VSLMRAEASATRRPAASMVFHYDASRHTDVMSRTVIAANWRYTEWDGGSRGLELYVRSEDPGEYRNRATDATQSASLKIGAEFLHALPVPKPGPANRPRALLPAGEKSN